MWNFLAGILFGLVASRWLTLEHQRRAGRKAMKAHRLAMFPPMN